MRSKIQHSWATAVEVVGTFTKQALKASKGDSDWLDYFRFASAEFSKLEEGTPEFKIKGADSYEKLVEYSQKLDVPQRLSAFNVAVEMLTNDKEVAAGYYILLLDLKRRIISISRHSRGELSEATNQYDKEEEQYRNDETKDLVMVSASSIKDLKKAYPNYFSDTVEFSKNIEKVHSANKAIQKVAQTRP